MTADFYHRLTPAELERLALLTEEAGEIIQITQKIVRHGYQSVNPEMPHDDDEENSRTNRRLLAKEIGHFLHALDLMLISRDLQVADIAAAQNDKARTIHRWLHHNKTDRFAAGPRVILDDR